MYINEAQQKIMVELINEYMLETNCGEFINRKSNFIMKKLFTNYMDKIIMGIIYTPKYKFNTYAEVEELFQQAREAIISSIHKNQFNISKGGPFNFFSTVVSKNLMNYTCKLNKYMGKKSHTDISKLYNNESITYYHDMEQEILFTNIIDMLLKFFEDKESFRELTILLTNYHNVNAGNRFIKKHFIQYAKGHGFSPSFVNTFFLYCKRLGRRNDMKDLLHILELEENETARRI